MDWRLRRAGSADAAAVALVAQATFLQTYAGTLDAADLVAHCARHLSPAALAPTMLDPRACVTLAEHVVGAAPVGYSVLTPCDLPLARANDVELKRIYTLSTTHGTGLGVALLTRAAEDARSLGAARMLLGVYHGNARARRFYEREGFEVIGERPFTVGETTHVDPVYARDL